MSAQLPTAYIAMYAQLTPLSQQQSKPNIPRESYNRNSCRLQKKRPSIVPLVTVVVAGEVEVDGVDEGRGATLSLVEVSHLLSLTSKDKR